MDVKEAILSAMKEIILPELNVIKQKQVRQEERINSVDQRLADINAHLVDQSRRIDNVRDELVGMIGETNKRIDSVRNELVGMIGETNKRIDTTNTRMDRLYEVVVRKEDHSKLESRVANCEKKLIEIERKLAA